MACSKFQTETTVSSTGSLNEIAQSEIGYYKDDFNYCFRFNSDGLCQSTKLFLISPKDASTRNQQEWVRTGPLLRNFMYQGLSRSSLVFQRSDVVSLANCLSSINAYGLKGKTKGFTQEEMLVIKPPLHGSNFAYCLLFEEGLDKPVTLCRKFKYNSLKPDAKQDEPVWKVSEKSKMVFTNFGEFYQFLAQLLSCLLLGVTPIYKSLLFEFMRKLAFASEKSEEWSLFKSLKPNCEPGIFEFGKKMAKLEGNKKWLNVHFQRRILSNLTTLRYFLECYKLMTPVLEQYDLSVKDCLDTNVLPVDSSEDSTDEDETALKIASQSNSDLSDSDKENGNSRRLKMRKENTMPRKCSARIKRQSSLRKKLEMGVDEVDENDGPMQMSQFKN